jgi:hypothetical protein
VADWFCGKKRKEKKRKEKKRKEKKGWLVFFRGWKGEGAANKQILLAGSKACWVLWATLKKQMYIPYQ